MTERDRMDDVQRSLGRIEGKLDEMQRSRLADLEEARIERARIEVVQVEHGKRISALEKRQHWYSGIAAGVGMLLGFGGDHLIKPP